MRCRECGAENRESARFCGECGARSPLLCPQCGAEIAPDLKFCDQCGTRLAGPAPATAPLEAVAERLQRLVPREFAERLLAIQGQVSKERRVVTILYSDVKGSTPMAERLDPEEFTEIMEGAFDLLIEPITRYEGRWRG
jgi:class 3 adenylate cyclase